MSEKNESKTSIELMNEMSETLKKQNDVLRACGATMMALESRIAVLERRADVQVNRENNQDEILHLIAKTLGLNPPSGAKT